MSRPPGLVCPPSSGQRLGAPASVASLRLAAFPDVVDSLELVASQKSSVDEMASYVKDSSSALRPVWIPVAGVADCVILCDVSLDSSRPRPIVPAALVRRLLTGVHGLSHQGGNALLRDVHRRYVWRNMSSQTKDFFRSCIPCQRAKVTRHTKSPLAALVSPLSIWILWGLSRPLRGSSISSRSLTVTPDGWRQSRWLR